MRKSLISKSDLRQRIKIKVLLTTLISLVFTNLNPLPVANAAANPLEILSVTEVSDTSVELLFNSKISKSKIKHYVITATFDPLATNSPDGVILNSSNLVGSSTKKVLKVKSTGLISTKVNNLTSKAAYIFTVSAKMNQGKLITSEPTNYLPLSNLMDAVANLPADWGNPKPTQLPTPTPTTAPLAAPAFTLSSSSETRTVNTAATGFTVSSTGGAIASFAINATPPGMSFNTSTGALTGTPNTVAGATAYTITGTNTSGSATATFSLTVTVASYSIGSTGPGGGKIFYVTDTPFACGPTLASTCKYLEAAPISGINAWVDDVYTFSGNTATEIGVTAQGAAIGTGYKNTLAIVGQSGGGDTPNRAATVSRSYRGPNNLTDWYLPSINELTQLYLRQSTIGGFAAAEALGTGPLYDDFWSSTESGAETALIVWFDLTAGADGGVYGNSKAEINVVRPIRAFE
jgi:hypothetical protein